jgi:RND family efflux transporter MFP subunit
MNPQTGDISALARAEKHRPQSDSSAPPIPPPSIRWKTRVMLPGVILLITAALLGYAARGALWPAKTVRVVPVLVKAGGEISVPGAVVAQAPGWVEADPFSTAVSALADGVIESVLVLEGEWVEQGQVVARLVDDDAQIELNHDRALLAGRKAALAAAQAALQEAERNWEHPIELTRKLHTSQAQLAEKRAELDRWPAELERALARAVYLQAEYERTAPLHEHDQATDIELVEARQAHEEQQAEVEAVRKRKPILEAQIRALESEVKAAEENLRLRIVDTRALAVAKATAQQAEAAVASAEAKVEEAELRLERMEVRSPVAGRVMARLVEPGSKLMLKGDQPRSAHVVRLYDPKKLQVRVDVPLVDAAKVGVEQDAEVIVDVLPDRVFRGRVTRVVHEADIQKNTLQVKVAIENPSPEIKPEMLARARFLARADSGGDSTRQSGQRVFVPRTAILDRQGQEGVWLADQIENVARWKIVTPGAARIEDWTAIDDGLAPGDRVIVEPPADLADGQRIRIEESPGS